MWQEVSKLFQDFRISREGPKGVYTEHRAGIIFISVVAQLHKLILVGGHPLIGKTFLDNKEEDHHDSDDQ